MSRTVLDGKGFGLIAVLLLAGTASAADKKPFREIFGPLFSSQSHPHDPVEIEAALAKLPARPEGTGDRQGGLHRRQKAVAGGNVRSAVHLVARDEDTLVLAPGARIVAACRPT